MSWDSRAKSKCLADLIDKHKDITQKRNKVQQELKKLRKRKYQNGKTCTLSHKLKAYNRILDMTGKNIALIRDDFKCVRCGTEKDIQFHHLIPSTDMHRQDIRRHPKNIIILCMACHGKEHDIDNGDALCITPKTKLNCRSFLARYHVKELKNSRKHETNN